MNESRRTFRSSEMFATATAAFKSAMAEIRVELAQSEARVARLKYATELEAVGRMDEAASVLAEIRAEQQAKED